MGMLFAEVILILATSTGVYSPYNSASAEPEERVYTCGVPAPFLPLEQDCLDQ